MTTVPAITYVSFGLTDNLNIPTSTRTIWIDALTSANVTKLVPGTTAYEQWVVPTSQWTISCSNTIATCTTAIPSPSIVYYHQYLQDITNYQTSDHVLDPGTALPPQPSLIILRADSRSRYY